MMLLPLLLLRLLLLMQSVDQLNLCDSQHDFVFDWNPARVPADVVEVVVVVVAVALLAAVDRCKYSDKKLHSFRQALRTRCFGWKTKHMRMQKTRFFLLVQNDFLPYDGPASSTYCAITLQSLRSFSISWFSPSRPPSGIGAWIACNSRCIRSKRLRSFSNSSTSFCLHKIWWWTVSAVSERKCLEKQKNKKSEIKIKQSHTASDVWFSVFISKGWLNWGASGIVILWTSESTSTRSK